MGRRPSVRSVCVCVLLCCAARLGPATFGTQSHTCSHTHILEIKLSRKALFEATFNFLLFPPSTHPSSKIPLCGPHKFWNGTRWVKPKGRGREVDQTDTYLGQDEEWVDNSAERNSKATTGRQAREGVLARLLSYRLIN